MKINRNILSVYIIIYQNNSNQNGCPRFPWRTWFKQLLAPPKFGPEHLKWWMLCLIPYGWWLQRKWRRWSVSVLDRCFWGRTRTWRAYRPDTRARKFSSSLIWKLIRFWNVRIWIYSGLPEKKDKSDEEAQEFKFKEERPEYVQKVQCCGPKCGRKKIETGFSCWGIQAYQA